jgi:hypothetical protein
MRKVIVHVYTMVMSLWGGKELYRECLQSTTLILSYGVSTMKLADFGVGLRIGKFFFRC